MTGRNQTTGPEEAARPNLIYVLADQLRYQSCGYAGDPRARPPAIDAFSRESGDFRNAVSGYPICAPYRASPFTGKYASSTGMVTNELGSHLDPKNSYIPPGPFRPGFDGFRAAYDFHHYHYRDVRRAGHARKEHVL